MKKISLMLGLCMAFVWSINTADAQKYGKTEQDSINCIDNTSLYVESYKAKAYKDAYEPWKEVVKSCPASTVNIYIRGNNILKYMYSEAANDTEKEQYFKEMLDLYDTRAEAFGERWNNIAAKAMVYEQYKPNEIETIYNLYKQAKEVADENQTVLDQHYCAMYLKATINYLQKIKANTEQMSILFDVYDYASEAMETSLTRYSNELDEATQRNDEKAMGKLQKDVDNTRNNIQIIETLIEPFASCEKIVPIYEGRFNANPNDVALLKKITTNMERKGCTKEDLFFKATENLHKQEPTPRSAALMGQMLLAKEQYSEAVKYLREAENLAPEINTKCKAALGLAQALMKTKSFSEAREAARRAANYDKSYAGKASLLIANMYLATSGKEAAWAAYDEATRAKNLDPTIASDAQRVMNAAHGRFPSKSDIFFEGKEPGASVGVGGWIGGSTTIKVK